MADTAFDPLAFENDAFQIASTTPTVAKAPFIYLPEPEPIDEDWIVLI